MDGEEREKRWHAGAIGREPDDSCLVWADDAVTGPRFYARSTSEAECAASILNDLQSTIDDLSDELRGAGREPDSARGSLTKLADAIDEALNHHIGPREDGLRIPRHRSELIAELVNGIACEWANTVGELRRDASPST